MDGNPSAPRLHFGSVTLIPDERLVLKDGRPVPLTPKAFDLLAILSAHPGHLLTKEDLMQALWGDVAVEESNLAYHVFAIRKALGDAAENGQYIETVPKRGYRFTATVTAGDGGSGQPPPLDGSEDTPVATAAEGFAPPPSSRPSRSRLAAAAWFAAGALAIGVVALVTAWRPAPVPTPIRAQIAAGVQLSEASPFALAPDGQQLVFAGSGPDGINRLWVRRLDTGVVRPLAGTETSLGGLTPPMFWSPDSQSIAFDAAGFLKRVDVRGGARTICSLPALAVGGSWNADDVFLVGQPEGGLLRCAAENGAASELTRPDPAQGESAHVFPSFLPDKRHFLYLSVSRDAPERSGIYIGSLDDRPGTARRDRLIATGFAAAYARTSGTSAGHVLFVRDSILFAQGFDEHALQLTGEPIALAEPVGSFLDAAFFAVSQNDVIAFRGSDNEFQLTWLDRRGDAVGVVGDVGRYSAVTMSPDGSEVATVKKVGPNTDQDLWTFDVARPAMARVTFQPQLEDSPVWSADGKRLLFTTGGRIGTILEQALDGESAPQTLLKGGEHLLPMSVSADGRFLLYAVVTIGPTRVDTWVLSLDDTGRRFPLVQRAFDQWQAQFSPDGRWVAYVSNESGRNEVLLRRFVVPADGATVEPETMVVSSGGATAPRWRADGKELFFIAADGSVMAADVDLGARMPVGTPRALFQIPRASGDWAVAADGSRFLVAMPAATDTSAPFTILWHRLAALGTPAAR